MRKGGDFPNDVLSNILFRLPSVTVLRFKLVSKEWYSLISDPNFINLHSKRVSPNPKILLSLAFQDRSDFHLLDYESPSFRTLGPLCFPRETSDLKTFKIIGSSFRLVCVATSYGGGFYIWNPTTRESRKIPDFDSSLREHRDDYLHGLGYDPVSNDFKVVISLYPVDYVTKLSMTYNVYSLKRDSWKKVISPFQYYYNPRKFPTRWQVPDRPIQPDPIQSKWKISISHPTDKKYEDNAINTTALATFLNGVFHWLVRVPNEIDPHIIAFNSSRETFRKLRIPDEKIGKLQMRADLDKACGIVSLLEHKGCLCLFCSTDESLDAKEIWVMKEYGDYKTWTHLLNVFGSAVWIESGFLYKPLCVTSKNEVVFHTTYRLIRWSSGKVDSSDSTYVGAYKEKKTGEFNTAVGRIHGAALVDETVISLTDFNPRKSILSKSMSNCRPFLNKAGGCCSSFRMCRD